MIRAFVLLGVLAALQVPSVATRLQVIGGDLLTGVNTSVMITSPTSNPTFDNGTSDTVAIAGGAASDRAINVCTWTNSLGGSGTATGTNSWSASVTGLSVGSNVLTVTCPNAGGGTGSDILTVTRSSGADCPALPSFPDENCTGWVHTGVTLTAYSGPTTITSNGTIIDSKDITSCLLIQADNVIIRKSRIRNDCSGGVIFNEGTNLLVEDVEIDCVAGGVNNNGTGLTPANYTARRVNAYGCENVMWADNDVLIEDSYIHDILPYDPKTDPHTDGVQLPGGASNITIRHSRIYGQYLNGSNFGNSAFTTGGGVVNFLVEDNLMAGGGFTARCEGGGGNTNYRVINNRFSTIFVATVGGFGPVSECATNATTYSGNVCHETGLPLTNCD